MDVEEQNRGTMVRFYAGETHAMSTRCERFAHALERHHHKEAADLHRISDELDAIARRLEGRS